MSEEPCREPREIRFFTSVSASWQMRLWAFGLGLWALGFGLWALGFGLWALGCGIWALGQSMVLEKEHSHSVECEGHMPCALQTSGGEPRNAPAADSASNASWGWGARSGNQDDKDDLSDIITAELIKTGNPGDYFWSKTLKNLSSKVWTRISLRLFIQISTRTTRDGKWTIPMPVPGSR